MLTEAPPKPTPTPAAPARARRRRPSRLTRSLRTAGLFLLGLAGAAWLADWAAGRHVRKTLGFNVLPFGGGHIVGADVYGATWRARRRMPEVRTILLGDSVARQLFPPGMEPKELNGRFRFLTSNQAISMAGQYYLLQDALRSCPGTTDVYLLYFPGSLANDLGPDFTHDYFCGYFHSPRQIAEVFAVKRDITLLASQVGHGLFPNLMLLNSASHAAPVLGAPAATAERPATTAGYQQLPSNREPLLEAATALAGAPPLAQNEWDPTARPYTRQLVVQSAVTRHFLPKIRALCRERGVRLHVLPCPCSEDLPYRDADGVYDGPIVYFDRGQFMDSIHFQAPFLEAVRRRVAETYGLDPALAATRE
jgi:hypothetical protein